MINQSETTKIRTVIAARPGVNQKALRATLAQFPNFEICGVMSGGLSTLELVRTCRPALLIIDSGLLQDEIEMLLLKTKQEQKQIRIIVVTDTRQQQQRLLDLGAANVLLHNEPIEKLLEVLRSIPIPYA